MDTLVAAIAAGQYIDTFDATMTSAAGLYQSLWRTTGRPSGGAVPGSTSGIIPTSATAGAIPFTDPGGSDTAYLYSLQANNTVAGTLILYDRCVTSDGLSGTVTTAQTVGTPSLTRHAGGANVGAYLEYYTATGATAVTCTVNYTDQNGTSGNTTSFLMPGSPKVGEMLPIPLAAGDTGVQAIASVTLSATTGTAGSFGVTLAYRYAQLPIVGANLGQVLDYAALGLPIIAPGSCLAYAVLSTTTTTGNLITGLGIASG